MSRWPESHGVDIRGVHHRERREIFLYFFVLFNETTFSLGGTARLIRRVSNRNLNSRCDTSRGGGFFAWMSGVQLIYLSANEAR